jgi:hypothetical protein
MMMLEFVAQWDRVQTPRERDEGRKSCHKTKRRGRKGLRMQFEDSTFAAPSSWDGSLKLAHPCPPAENLGRNDIVTPMKACHVEQHQRFDI